MRRRLPPKGGNRKILSAILAAVTSMSPVMTYAAEVTEPPSDMIETIITPQVTIKKLNIDTTSGGYVILNQGLDSERIIKEEEKDGVKEFKIYDGENILINTVQNEYMYEASEYDVVNVKAVSDDGYEIAEFNILDENTGFTAPQKEFLCAAVMDADKTLRISFTKSEQPESSAAPEEDLTVKLEKNNEQTQVNADVDDDLTVNSSISNTETKKEDEKQDTSSDNVCDNINDDELRITDNEDEQTEKESIKNMSKNENDAMTEPEKSKEDMDIENDDDLSVLNSDEAAISSVQNTESDQCYVLAYEISKIIDGTAPFDADNAAGNDSGDENKVVRSFDTINYTLKYTTAIRDSSIYGVDEAYVKVRFVLPLSNREAVFDEATMNWCLNRKITYYYSDGTSSEAIDESKTMVKQVLTGERYLANSDSGNTIPGTGTLSTGIKVKAAVNETEIKPEFNIWIDGNQDTDIKTVISEPIIVSAAPKYNFSVIGDSGVDYLGYFNKETGEISSEKKDGFERGRLARYALNFQIYNDSAAKGLKGIELPSGNANFDIALDAELDGVSINSSDDYDIYVWDYSENESVSRGHNGKVITPGNSNGPAYYGPYNKNKNRVDYSCYNGGSINITPNEADKRLYRVSFSNYEIDYEKMHFPKRYRWSNEGNVTYGANIGCISAGQILVLSTFPDTVDTQKTLYQDVQIQNTDITSVSGQKCTDIVSSDNRARRGITLYPTGWVTKYQRYCDRNNNVLATVYYAGDNISTLGSYVNIESFIHGKAEFSFSDFNLLQKFDDEALEIDDGTFTYWTSYVSNKHKIKILFAAKPDKTGWINDSEMGSTYEENLIYFDDINALRNAGYTCVGVLYEIRDADTSPITVETSIIDLFVRMKVKTDTSIIGKVFQTTSELRAWRKDTGTMKFSWTDMPYNTAEKSYGAGKDNTEYVDGYTNPYICSYTGNSYQKVSYVNGVMYGHNGYNLGNSLLIVGDLAGVTIKNADKTGNDEKTVYDMDMGERTANFTISPTLKIKSENAGTFTADLTDDVTVTVKLPKNLHYSKSSKEPESVIENANGTTTVIWKFYDQNLKDAIPPISLATIIGEEGTANDVVNNERLVVSASVSSINDPRASSLVNGNYSETQITVIKLAASAVTKRVLTPLVERLQDIEFRLRYSNLSDTEAINAKIYDILPYNDDGRGSAFSGSCNLKSMVIDFSNAKKTYQNGKNNIACYVSSTERNKNTMDNLVVTGTGLNAFTKISGAVLDDANYKISWDNISAADAASVYTYLGYVFGHEYIDVYLTLTPKDTVTRQQPGDIYGNNFVQYADNQASNVTSNIVKAQVVKRDLSGVAWLDDNANGIREDGENLLRGVTVTLYRTKESKYVPAGSSAVLCIGDNRVVYPSLDVFVKPVRSTTTDENGYYHFDNLEDGPYLVEFGNIDKYYLTVTDAGNDDTIDSDAMLENTYYILIPDISLPEIANMTEWSFSSPHHDIGLIRKTKVEISKIGTVTKELLGGAELEIYNAADIEDGKPKDGASPVVKWTTEQGKKKTLENVLLAGKQYVLVEVKAPVDYAIADPITFTINAGGGEQQVTMSDDYDTHPVSIRKKNLNDQLIGGAVLQITGKEDGKADNMEPVQWTSEENKEHVVELRKGAYTLHEITPPAGYLPAEDIRFTVDKDGNIFIAGNKTDAVEMTDIQVKSCKVTIKKYESDGKTPLAGVTFKLEFLSAKYPDVSGNKNYSRLLKPGESKELTSDSNGEIVFDNLDQGEYVLSETKTSSGHMLMKDSIHISLPLEMTDEEVKQAGNIDMTKAEKFGGLNHFYELKYDISNGAVLDMPKTGDNGFWKFGILGFGLMAAVFAVMTKRKKKS